jgi:hypothetical protein
LRVAVLLALLVASAMLAPVVLDANLGGFVRSGSLHALAAAAGVFVIAALRTRSDRIAGTALVLLVAADLARLLGIDYALLSDHGSDSAQPPGLRTLWSPVPGVRLFGVTHRLPRVFLSFHAARLPATQLQARLLDEDVVAGRETLLEESSPDLPLLAAKAEPVPCTIETYAATRLSARCVADRPAVAVFVEQQLDGWSATVDGRPSSPADREHPDEGRTGAARGAFGRAHLHAAGTAGWPGALARGAVCSCVASPGSRQDNGPTGRVLKVKNPEMPASGLARGVPEDSGTPT